MALAPKAGPALEHGLGLGGVLGCVLVTRLATRLLLQGNFVKKSFAVQTFEGFFSQRKLLIEGNEIFKNHRLFITFWLRWFLVVRGFT